MTKQIITAQQKFQQSLAFHRQSDNIKSYEAARAALDTLDRYERGLQKRVGYAARSSEEYTAMMTLRCEVLTHLSFICIVTSKFMEALEYAEQGISANMHGQNLTLQCKLLTHKGMAYLNISNFSESLEFLQQALSISEEALIEEQTAKIFHQMANVYYGLKYYQTALTYYTKAEIAALKAGNEELALNELGDIGMVHDIMGEHEKAITILTDVVNRLKKYPDLTLGTARHLCNLATALLHNQQVEEALECFEEARNLCIEIGFTFGIAIILEGIGDVYVQSGSLLYNPSKAVAYYLQSLQLHESLGSQRPMMDLYITLSKFYAGQSQWQEAYHYLKQADDIRQVIANEEVLKMAEQYDWKLKLAVIQKEKEAERVSHEKEREYLFYQMEIQAQEVQNTIEALVKKNILLRQIQGDIQRIIPHTHGDGYIYIRQLSERIERNILAKEENQMGNTLSAQGQSEIIKKLQRLFPHFSTMELKVVALLNMKLTSSGIASALFLSRRTVEVHRRSIRKKMGLKTTDDIYTELAKIIAE